MEELNLKIIVACHHKCDVPNDSIYLPLHVGAHQKESIGFERDDSGEQISMKNPNYCELTGLYWAWKNLSFEYLGLVHYRRYFTLHSRKKCLSAVLSREEAEELCRKYRVVVPSKRRYYIETLYLHYAHTFDCRHFDEARNIIALFCPEYLSSFDIVMNQRSGYMFNMFMMSRELVDAYCQWLFPILNELEHRIDTSEMTAFEARYLGRVSERLWNVWLHRNIKKEDMKEVPYLYLGKVDYIRKIKSFLMAKLFHRKYDRSF